MKTITTSDFNQYDNRISPPIKNLIKKGDLLAIMEKLLCTKNEYDATSLTIIDADRKLKKGRLKKFDRDFLNEQYQDRAKILTMFYQAADYIYFEAHKLKLPTKPYNLLYLGSSWPEANQREQDKLMDKANDELKQLGIELDLVLKTKGIKKMKALTAKNKTSGKAEGTEMIRQPDENIKSGNDFIKFLTNITQKLDSAIIGNHKIETLLVKHSEKIIRATQAYSDFLYKAKRIAEKEGWPQGNDDESLNKLPKGLNLQFYQFILDAFDSDNPLCKPNEVYNCFYIEDKPENPKNPLKYLLAMVDCWQDNKELCNGLEVEDYRYFLLTCIHDCQNDIAGLDKIYFMPQDDKELKNRICKALFGKLKYYVGKSYITKPARIIDLALQQLLDTATKEKLKTEQTGTRQGGDKRRQPITLKAFIETYCNLSGKVDVQSKVSLLHEYNLKGKIKLTKLVSPYKKGQHKYYYAEDLKGNWPKYQLKMPTLPPLKQAGS